MPTLEAIYRNECMAALSARGSLLSNPLFLSAVQASCNIVRSQQCYKRITSGVGHGS